MVLDEAMITTEIMENTLRQEVFPEIKVIGTPKLGKVRTVYHISSDQLILISSDNLSTHDVVHKRQIFGKGDTLDDISAHFFNVTGDIVPNHFERRLAPNTWLVKRAQPILVEFVLRQYLTGSGWKDYESKNGPANGSEFCGVNLRAGYRKNERLDSLIFTPTAKGAVRDFPIAEFATLNPDEDDPKITIDMIKRNYQAFGLRKPDDLDFVIDAAFKVYQRIEDELHGANYLLADTKFEFGYLPDGRIGMIDESVTPDSSRFWRKGDYVFNPGKSEFTIVQDDKQHFRDKVEELGLHKKKAELADFWMPDDIVRKGIVKYNGIREAITGQGIELTTQPRKQVILTELGNAGFLN